MNTEKIQELGTLLAQVAKGEVPLASLAGLDAKGLAEILSQAIAQMQIGRDDKARAILDVLIALDPANPLFHEYMGLACERSGDQDRAHTAYSENIEGLKKLKKADDRLCEGYLLRARLHATQGKLEAAATDLVAAKSHHVGQDPELGHEIMLLEQAVAGVTR